MVNRTIDRNAVPVIYSVKTPIQLKSAMFSNMREEGLDYMMKNYQYYKIEDEDLKKRLMNPYVQTNRLVDEAISLEQVVTQGYINLKEKAGNRKDRVMSLAYGLWYAKLLEDQYINKQETNSLLDWTFFG